MHVYLYDSSLADKKFASTLARIETRLTDLSIGGKIFRLSPLRNLDELLRDEVRIGTKTIIAVGNDKTFGQVINAVAPLDITVGFIPIGNNNNIAQTLGIPNGEAACNVIAARTIEHVDLGRANNTFFLSSITVGDGEVTIECDDQYRVIPRAKDRVSICNLRPILADAAGTANYFDPKDGLLEIFIKPLADRARGWFWQSVPVEQTSIIPFKKIAIRSRQSLPVFTDGQRVLKTPVEIEIVPKKLRVIVGKTRQF